MGQKGEWCGGAEGGGHVGRKGDMEVKGDTWGEGTCGEKGLMRGVELTKGV